MCWQTKRVQPCDVFFRVTTRYHVYFMLVVPNHMRGSHLEGPLKHGLLGRTPQFPIQ